MRTIENREAWRSVNDNQTLAQTVTTFEIELSKNNIYVPKNYSRRPSEEVRKTIFWTAKRYAKL